ncbi:hypothetical protein ACFL9U_10765 [Thermodesulfobacteriota bacterium]
MDGPYTIKNIILLDRIRVTHLSTVVTVYNAQNPLETRQDTAIWTATAQTNALSNAILTLKVLSGLNPAAIHTGVDVNGDNKLGLEDVIYNLREAAGLK